MKRLIRIVFFTFAVVAAFRAGSYWQRNLMEIENFLCLQGELDIMNAGSIEEQIRNVTENFLSPVIDRISAIQINDVEIQGHVDHIKSDIENLISALFQKYSQ